MANTRRITKIVDVIWTTTWIFLGIGGAVFTIITILNFLYNCVS